MLRDGVMIMIALMCGGCFGVVVTCCMVTAKRSDQELGDMMKEKEEDGDAMRKRNHVIPVRLRLPGNSGNWRNRWKKAD